MRLLTVDELLAHPQRAIVLLRKEDLMVTAKGRPVALFMRVENGDIDETLRVVRRVRAEAAVAKMRTQARKSGANRMSLAAINAEIRAVRQQRKSA